MPEERFTILSTRPLEQSILLDAGRHNILIDSLDFIRTEPIISTFLEKRLHEIASLPSTIVITSMNAAGAVADYVKGFEPQWNIYCLGTATKTVITDNFPDSTIIGEGQNASVLADLIINKQEKAVIFFCGNQRRDELPAKLQQNNILLEEIVVYRTFAIPQKVEKTYDGILFFSPSAAESFFSVNTVSEHTLLFAIGTTTAACLAHYSRNKIIETNLPGKKNLVEEAISYFGKLNHTNEHIK
jgi:uroporphyrinogen-III synthase